MTPQERMEKALAEIEKSVRGCACTVCIHLNARDTREKLDSTVAALKEALKESEKQHPYVGDEAFERIADKLEGK